MKTLRLISVIIISLVLDMVYPYCNVHYFHLPPWTSLIWGFLVAAIGITLYYKLNWNTIHFHVKCWWRRLTVNSKRKSRERMYKTWFRNFFEDSEWTHAVVTGTSIIELQITDIKFKFKRSKTIMYITSCRPGLLIGKGGKQIDLLNAHLSCEAYGPVEIQIIESKLW